LVSAFARSAVVTVAILSVPLRVAAQESSLRFDEFRLGASASGDDRPLSAYAQIEALLSPFGPAATYDPNVSWLFSPRPLVGASISLQGRTSDAFAGLAWKPPMPTPFFLEFSFGGMVHDQKLFEVYPDRPRLTTRFLFRESIAIGYDIDQRWRIIAFADHGSNGNLGYANRSIDHVGMMLSARFGEPVQGFAAPAPPPISSFSWAGPYVGISGAYAPTKLDFVIHDPAASTDFISGTASSVNVSGYFGYNWTVGFFVAGIETEMSAQHLSASAQQSVLVPEVISVSSQWLATARARMGIDVQQIDILHVQRLLLYATGGAAFTRVAKGTCNHATDRCYINGEVADGWITEGGSRIGWTVGGGVEIPLAAHAAAKFEYLYADFGRIDFGNGRISNEVNFCEHILRAGISFGFDGR
jgi:lipid A 3-O-deacylase